MELSEKRKALLQKLLAGEKSKGETSRLTIPKRAEGQPAPLSYPQRQIWSHSQLADEALIYNEPVTIRRHGDLDRATLERSFTEIVRRHEAWRTVFRWEGDEPLQVVQPPPAHVAIPLVDLGSHPDSESEALRLATEDARQKFDLARGPLYRLRLVRLSEWEHRFFLTLHHLIFDGVSLYRVFLPELVACYDAFTHDRRPVLAELPIQYNDFATWQTMTPVSTEQVSYWEKTLRDLPALALPNDHPRPARQTFAGGTVRFEVPRPTSAALGSLAQKEGATPFMTMVAAFTALLNGYSGQEEIVIGGISGGRNQSETRTLLGCFLNTLVIRTSLRRELSFVEHLARVKSAVLGALAHGEVPFEILVRKFAGKRDPGCSPLVQALIVLEPPLESLGEGWDFSHMDVDMEAAKFDLQLGLDDRGPEGLTGRFIYNRALFEPATIERLTERWLRLLDQLTASPGQSLGALTHAVFAQAKRSPQSIPREWNGRSSDYPRDASIQELFEKQVADARDAVALVSAEKQLTYDELNRRANQLAHRLRKMGVGRDVPVGIFLDRSIEFVVAALAILKAGGAYLPIDPSSPPERLAFLIEETQTKVILAARSVGPPTSISTGRAEVLWIDQENLARGESELDLPNESGGGDLAYIMFTSGSTGQPKGVAVPHRAVVRLVRGTNYATFSPNETFLLLAPTSFDASTFEIFGPLLNGGRLVVMSVGSPSLEEIGAAIREQGVTTLWLTSGLFNAMVDERLSDLRPLRQLLTGGDVLSVAHVEKTLQALPKTRLINGYGPTENTTFSCCHTIERSTLIGTSIPIGRPIANSTAYILNPQLEPVAVGESGELFLGGDGLARGHWRRPELTSEKFISDPFDNEPGARLYRSGDLARWRPDGTIEFLGRRDRQAKMHGFRIELDEIENALRRQSGVRDAAVILRKDSPNEKHLVGYVVGERSAEELREALKNSLPGYLVPSTLVRLEAFPRTANGKLDRGALPAPAEEKTIPIFAPRTPLEKKLAEMWGKVLGLEEVGTRDNFFSLGGHSLLGLRLINQLGQALDEPLSLVLIFEAPTIATLAEVLQSNFPASVARWVGEVEERLLPSCAPIAAPLRRSLGPVVAVNRELRRGRRPDSSKPE